VFCHQRSENNNCWEAEGGVKREREEIGRERERRGIE